MNNSTELIIIDDNVRLGSLSASGPEEILAKASQIATALGKVVDAQKLYTMIQGRKYVRVEGWNTLGALLGIVPREVSVSTDADGGYEAVVELVRVYDGMVIGRGSAICGMDERTWKTRDAYARRSMAITRATGKAFRLGFSWIMTLAGYEPTPWEEMPVIESDPAPVVEPAQKPAQGTRKAVDRDKSASPAAKTNGGRPLAPEKLREYIDAKAAGYVDRSASDKQVTLLRILLDDLYSGDKAQRHTATLYLCGVASTSDLTDGQVLALIDWIGPEEIEAEPGKYVPSDYAIREAQSVLSQALREEGQLELIEPE